MKKKLLSVVIPMYNEEGNVSLVLEELKLYLEKLTHFTNYEIIAVNDGSSDATLQKLMAYAKQDERLKVVSFTRNFGHEQATLAGIHHAQGEATMLIDADCQDPPELLLTFEKEYLRGFDIVYGQRTKRLNESWVKKITSFFFYPIFKYLTKVDIPRNVGDFCLLSNKVTRIICDLPEKTVFIRGLIYWSGLPKKAVPFIRRSREQGISKYNYRKLTLFALDNIISFSTAPIHFIILFSLGIIGFCIAGSVAALTLYKLGYVVTIGWTSLILCMLFLFSSLLLCMGIIGLYIGKIFQEIKQRPVYLVGKKINFYPSGKLPHKEQPTPSISQEQNAKSNPH